MSCSEEFKFLVVYMMLALLKRNGKILMRWLSEQFQRLFMYSYIEALEDENTASVTRASVCV